MVRKCSRCGQVHDAYTGCTLMGAFGRPTVVGEDEALVGSVVAERYRVGDVLGQGATGTVFAVEHVSFGRPAVMKVLRPRHADAGLVARVFHDEARAAWNVTHPCLCEVFDVGALPDGTPFFVTERLEGETLAARIARDRMSLGSAVDVVMQILSAMATVHARHLLLRDLRPQNVFLVHRRGCRPLVKILDFGLASLTSLEIVRREWETLPDTAGARTGLGAVPYYVSPERTRGEQGIEPASDLFVAAVILYEALTGERPFTAPSFEGILRQICQGRPVPLHERRPDVPAELGAFVARALSPSPRARPTSAKDMQDELRAIFENVRRPSPAHAPARPGSRPDQEVAAGRTPAAPGKEPGEAASLAGEPTRPRFGDVYADETETQRTRRAIDALPAFEGLDSGSFAVSDDDVATEALPAHPALVDESLGEPADRTLQVSAHGRPPGAIAPTETLAEDEETETMRLAPELRARVEELTSGPPSEVARVQPAPVIRRPKP